MIIIIMMRSMRMKRRTHSDNKDNYVNDYDVNSTNELSIIIMMITII